MNTSALSLAFTILMCFGCATRRGATVTTTPTQTTASVDWRAQNEERPDVTVLIPATSPLASAFRVPSEWTCRNEPVDVPGRTSVMVRFTAPLRGAYAVSAIDNVQPNGRSGQTLEMTYVRVDEAGTVVTCYFSVRNVSRVEAVHITRYEMSCHEGFRCQYSGVPIDTMPHVEVAGHTLQNGQRFSFFGAHLTMLNN